MNTDKTVSIIMGTYNGAEYIREQLDSTTLADLIL